MNNSKSYTFLIAIVIALGGFLMGFDASVISGAVGFIETEFELTKIQLGWAVSCLTLTSALGMAISGPLSDKIGRKQTLKYAAVIFFISAVASGFAPNYSILIIARMLGGFGVGASLILAPMYIAEIAPSKIRGKLVSLNQLNIVLGISIAFFMNYLILKLGKSDVSWIQKLEIDMHNWRYMLGIEALPAILFYFLLLFVPESPRWLLIKGKEEKARGIFRRLYEKEKIDAVVESIKASFASDKKDAKVKDLFHPALRLILLIGVVVAISQQISGINAVFFFAPTIFELTGIGTDASFSQATLVGLTNLVFTILAMGFIDRIGRKPLLIGGMSGIILSLFILATTFGQATYSLNDSNLNEIPQEVDRNQIQPILNKVYKSDIEFLNALETVINPSLVKKNESKLLSISININARLILLGILGFIASFAVSLGPVMWVLLSEIFPNKIRALAISFVGFINSSISFLVQLVFPWEITNLGSAATFYIYAGFVLCGLVFIIIKVPETKGRTLEEIELDIMGVNSLKINNK